MNAIFSETPAKARPFRGWTMAFVAFASLALTFGPSGATLPLFYGAIVEEFGWSLTDATLLYTYKNLAAAIATLLVIGPLIVRFGLRRVMIAGFALTATGMIAFLFVDARPVYYAAGVLQGVGLATVVVGSNVLISRWFIRNQGLALGIALSGMSVGGVVFPLVAQPMIAGLGWRVAMACLSVVVCAVALPLYIWKARERPADDELAAEAPVRAQPALLDRREPLDKREQLDGSGVVALVRVPGFWRVASAVLLIAAADMAMVQHTSLLLVEQAGVGQRLAALVLAVMFGAAVAGKLIAGRLYDRLSINGMCLWHVFTGVSIVMIFFVDTLAMLLVFAVMRGVAHGGLLPKPAVLARHCYSRQRLDVGLPWLLGIWMVGAGIGPIALALVFDATGHYRYGLALLVACCGLAALLLRGVRPAYRDAQALATPAFGQPRA